MFNVFSKSKSKGKRTVSITLNMSYRARRPFLQQNAFKCIPDPLFTTRSSVLLSLANLICGAANATQVSISGLLVRSPEGQVVSQKLHDQSGILVGIFCHVVKLCNGVLKGCAGHFASFIRIIQHLIHEH